MNKQPVDYKQYDKRWASIAYNGPKETGRTIKSSGCGPTCAAMVIASMKDKSVTPVEACAWSRAHGYKYKNQGTAWGYFVPQLKAYGIGCKQLLKSCISNQPKHAIHDQVKDYLAQGYWVIALMGRKSSKERGTWTTGGHYILVWDWDSKVRINDPIHVSGNNKYCNGNPETFKNEVRQYWLVDARAYNGKDVAEPSITATAALDKLAKLGVINSPDYWKQVVSEGKVRFLDSLVIKAAGKITMSGERSSSVEDGVGALVEAGVITSPNYWLDNRDACPGLRDLLCALGGAVKASSTAYSVRVTANALNIRQGPGTGYGIAGCIRDRGVYMIAEESAGAGASKWGRLKSGEGWISLDYCEKI